MATEQSLWVVFWLTFFFLITHWGLVMQCVGKLCHPWFRYWLVAYSAPNHHLNQCWCMFKTGPLKSFHLNFNQMSTVFIQENEFEDVVCKVAAILYQPQCVNTQKLPLCHYISCMSILQACWHMHFYVLFICQYVDMHHCSYLSIHQNWHLHINILTHHGGILFIPHTKVVGRYIDFTPPVRLTAHLSIGFLWWAPSAKRKDHHGVSSGWSSVWHCSNTGLSSSQYQQISIILGVWPFCLTPFFFRSITFWRADGSIIFPLLKLLSFFWLTYYCSIRLCFSVRV